MTRAKTYTILLTVHYGDKPADIHQIADQIQQGLEEGTRSFPGRISAMVSVFDGDRMGGRLNVASAAVRSAKQMHSDHLND
jgi:hypothetical protein